MLPSKIRLLGARLFHITGKAFQHSCHHQMRSIRQRRDPFKLVIFDKDGTLACFNSMWGPWTEYNVEKLERVTGKNLSNDIYSYFNYNKKEKKFGKSALVHDTHAVVRDGILDIMMEKHDIPRKEAEKVFDECWEDAFQVGGMCFTETVAPLGNVREIFQVLKKRSIKTAVCSSDGRKSVKLTLKALEIEELVDEIVCGDDSHNVPKPAPDNVHYLCRKFGVEPEDTVMVGDSYCDTKMGKDSNCGLIIGILSGQSDEADLRDANYLMRSLDDILPLVCLEDTSV